MYTHTPTHTNTHKIRLMSVWEVCSVSTMWQEERIVMTERDVITAKRTTVQTKKPREERVCYVIHGRITMEVTP
jgi:hypothetical protein